MYIAEAIYYVMISTFCGGRMAVILNRTIRKNKRYILYANITIDFTFIIYSFFVINNDVYALLSVIQLAEVINFYMFFKKINENKFINNIKSKLDNIVFCYGANLLNMFIILCVLYTNKKLAISIIFFIVYIITITVEVSFMHRLKRHKVYNECQK